jgi:hypothetical protein
MRENSHFLTTLILGARINGLDLEVRANFREIGVEFRY